MKGKRKRILSAVFACVMVFTLLPVNVLAAVSTTSTVTFKIVNGTWNNVSFGSDATVSDDKTAVTFTTSYSSKVGAYVYKCSNFGGTMEAMLDAVLNGTAEGSKYIVPDTGYTLNGMSTQDWTVNLGGGLVKNSSKTAFEQMELIKTNVHAYDDHGGDEKDGFAANTVYTLTLTKASYSVTYTFQSGTEGVALPKNVKDLEPVDSTDAKYNGSVERPVLSAESVSETEDGIEYVWTFDGWYTDAAMTQTAAFPLTVIDDIDLYGKWTRTEKGKVTITVNYVDESNNSICTASTEDIYTGGSYDYSGNEAKVPGTITFNGKNYVKISVAGELSDTDVTTPVTITVTYGLDEWKDADQTQEDQTDSDSETGGDGIPDSQQALIRYQSADPGKGSVSPTLQVVTLTEVTQTGTYAGTAALDSTAAANDGNAFDYWQAPGADGEKSYNATLSGDLTVAGGQTYTYTANFDTDEKGTIENGAETGDGTPDKYQVFVSFVSTDTTKGTITDKADAAANTGTYQVYTFEDHAQQGSATPSMAGVAVTPADGNAFDIWTKDDDDTTAVNPTDTLENIDGSTTITFKAHFAEDQIGEQGSDSIPDKYQAVVTYAIENGTWSDGTGTNKTEVFALKTKNAETGAWDDADPAPTLGDTVPTGMTANADYDNSAGSWGTNAPTAETVVTGNATYTYAYGTRNTYSISVTVTGGTADPSDTSIAVDYGGEKTIVFTANDNCVLDSVTVNGAVADLTDGTYTFTNVTADQSIQVVYKLDTKGNPDENGSERGDGIPDEYQVFVRYAAGANGSLNGETYKAYDLRQQTTADLQTSVTLTFPTPVANSGYQFSGWTNPADVTVEDSVMSGFAAGAAYTFTASFTEVYDPPHIPPVVVPDPTIKVKGLNTVDHVTYIIGVGHDKVDPLGSVTRGEIAAIYFRLMTDEFRSANWSTENRFLDIPDNAWYTMAVLTLDQAGVITDSDDGYFRPNAPITRAELAVMAAQFCTVTGNIPRTSFQDIPTDYWAAKEIALVEYAGWIEGYAGCFYPDNNLTRAEAVTIVNRMLQRGAETGNMLPDMVTFVDNAPDQWYYGAIQEAANSHDYTRTSMLLTGEAFRGEKWTALLEATDWAALEKAWIEANSKQ